MTYANIRLLIHELTGTNTTDLPSATLNLYTQPAEDHVAALLLANDSRWQYDDSNNTTTLPIDTQNLVSGQQDYSLGTTYNTLDRVELLPNGANTSTGWKILTQIDQQDFKGSNAQSLTSYRSTSGTPEEYDIVGNSIVLYPAPNYSQSASLKFYYTRSALKFDWTLGTFTDATGTTSSSPGFPSSFHELIPLWASYKYNIAHPPESGQSPAVGIFAAIQLLEKNLVDFYGLRNRDIRRRMTVSTNGGSGNQSGVLGGGASDSNH